MKKISRILPLILFCVFALLLGKGIQHNPKNKASALIDKPVPEFYLSDLQQPQLLRSLRDLPQQQWYLINVWGSWCTYCTEELIFLHTLAQRNIPIVGLTYRDKRQNALHLLKQQGNPYSLLIDDHLGKFALNLGVDGAPETFLVDPNGIIRYRYSGVLNEIAWQRYFLPKITSLASVSQGNK